jgi:hypothetical protein
MTLYHMAMPNGQAALLLLFIQFDNNPNTFFVFAEVNFPDPPPPHARKAKIRE